MPGALHYSGPSRFEGNNYFIIKSDGLICICEDVTESPELRLIMFCIEETLCWSFLLPLRPSFYLNTHALHFLFN